MTLLTPEIRALVGREAVYTAPEPIGRAAFRYFAIAVGDDNPIYRDDEAARAAGYPGVVAPPTLVVETNQYMDGEPDEAGYIGHSWGIEVPGTRAIRGGHDYEFHKPLQPDHIITARWTVAGVEEKAGSQGALLIVTSQARYENQHGELLATNIETLIFQEL